MSTQNSQMTPGAKHPHQATLDQEISTSAQCIGVTEELLQLWLDQYPWAQAHTLFSFLHLIKKYHLDPLVDELSIIKNTDGSCQAYITFDGWSKIINQHPQYAGMSLRESFTKEQNMPIWMECTIYRNDRVLPIMVTEYLDEVKTDHPSWVQMPKRMLRHRAIQQCARLAFGIAIPENKVSPDFLKSHHQATTVPRKKLPENTSQTEKLKNKLIQIQEV
jgi:hypothetical protein